jgi:hypothetical protein
MLLWNHTGHPRSLGPHRARNAQPGADLPLQGETKPCRSTIRRLAGRLAAYLAERAWHEGEPMRLTPADFEHALDRGIGSAFGIHWNTEGELTRDDQEPEPGFLSAWTGRQRTSAQGGFGLADGLT